MRKVRAEDIRDAIGEMVVEANLTLPEEQIKAIERAREEEVSPVGERLLGDMLENVKKAGERRIPICQDTGMAVVFIDIGQDVHIEGEDLETAVNQGVRDGYEKGYLRKSVVSDPLKRENTGDNTPAVIHTRIVPGDQVEITVLPKGFGSENCSRIAMLKPSDGAEGVKAFIEKTILEGAPNACAPVCVGVGIGGTFEKAALESKRALTLGTDWKNPDPLYRELTDTVLEDIKDSGIGPMGLGGIETILSLNILPVPTHIAGLPVAVNICCWVDRMVSRTL